MWCGDCTLKEAFLELCCLSRAMDSLVADVMYWFGGRIHWNFQFRRSLGQDWEEDSFDQFMVIICSLKVRGVGLHRVCWKLARSRGFEVKDFYLFLPSYSFIPLEVGVAIEGASKSGFLSWSASLGKVLTTNNFRKRLIIVLDWCYMCKKCGESVDQLLLHCPIAFEIRSLLFCLFGLHWVMPHKVIELFESWQGKFGRHCNIEFWRLVSHCLMWCI